MHKPGKVVAELDQQNVCGKTHTIRSSASASVYALPLMMVYPRKKAVPDH